MDDIVLGFKYKILEPLGEGSFGAVFKGQNIFTSENVAIKIESDKSNHKVLKHETQVSKYLNKVEGIPRMRWFGKQGNFLYTVFDLLGKDLVFYKTMNGKIPIASIKKIGFRLLEIIEHIHKKDIVHRDLKPDNIVMDRENKGNIHIIDFGLAKKYKNNGKHIEFKKNKPAIGSKNFCSINVMKGCEYSRRDDLISIGYILLYLYYDELPWEDKKTSSILCNKELENVVTSNDTLDKYLKYCYSLKFNETPNYKSLKTILIQPEGYGTAKYNCELT